MRLVSRALPRVDSEHVLLLKGVLLLAVVATAFLAAWHYGLLQRVWAGDRTGLSAAITFVFLVAAANGAGQLVRLSRALNNLESVERHIGRHDCPVAELAGARPAKASDLPRGCVAEHIDDLRRKARFCGPRPIDQRPLLESFETDLRRGHAFGWFVADLMLSLGLLGTVVGFILMLGPSHGGVAFTDLLFNALLGFVVMFVLAFLLINPIAQTGAIDPKAEFLITLTWPDGRREDVDLYVEDPAGNLVWFRAREAGLMHLDRDDLGRSNDVILVDGQEVLNPLNQEVVSVRGILPGEYVVNVHLYRAIGSEGVPATVKVEKLNPKVQVVFYGTIELRRQGDEQTAVRFSVAPDGRVHDVNRLPKALVPLRGAVSSTTPERRP